MSRPRFLRYRPRVPTPPRLSCQKPKARPRPPSRPPPPPWLPLSVATRPASQRTTLALRFESSPTLVLAGQRSRSTNNGVLLPRAISPPILAAPCSCFASADRIRLRQRCLIIVTRLRPVCSECHSSSTFSAGSDGSCVCTLLLETQSHRISRATRTANVMSVLSLYIDSRGGQRTTLSTIIYSTALLYCNIVQRRQEQSGRSVRKLGYFIILQMY